MHPFKNISLQQLWLGALHTFLRFPMVLLSAIAGTATIISLIEWGNTLKAYEQSLIKLIFVSSVGLVLFFTLELLVQRYKLHLRGRVLTWAGGLLFLVLYFFLLPAELEAKQLLRHLALLLALHLISSYAMFLNHREENAFWQFNKALFLRVLTSALYSAVLFIGLVVAIVALDQLFSIKVSEKIYGQLWVAMVGVFNTWFFLAGVPLSVRQLEQTHDYPKGLKVFTQFVLLPLVTVYLLILYAYLIKIVVEGEWPQGWVSVLVLGFSIAGILSLLLIHPIRNEAGNAWMRTFSKWFYRALFPLIILLALAIWRRVSEYGITEQRYVVLALAVWLLATVLYFLLSRNKNIKFIPITLSIIAMLAAFGPLNMFVVSEWSQVYRLRNLLQEHGVFEHGKVRQADKPVSPEAVAEISSIVDYLVQTHGLERLEDWFEADLEAIMVKATADTENKWVIRSAMRDEVMKLMGLQYSPNKSEPTSRYFNFVMNGYTYEAQGEVYSLSGYDYVAELSFNTDKSKHAIKLDKTPLLVSLEKEVLFFQLENETLRLELLPLLEKFNKQSGNIRTRTELTHFVKGRQARLQVVLQGMSGNQKGRQFEVTDAELLLFVKLL
jgi:hypothetical protein